MNPNNAIHTLVHAEDGHVMFSPCFEIVAICNVPLSESAPGYAQVYNLFLNVIRQTGRPLMWWRTNNMKNMRPWQEPAASMLPYWFQDEIALREPLLGLFAQGGSPKPGCLPPVLEFYHEHLNPERPQGAIRLAISVDAMDDPEQLHQLACATFNHLPLQYGWAGYAMAWHVDSDKAQAVARRILPPWLLRYPGLGSGDMMPAILASHLGLLTVNWLNAIGSPLAEKLGGMAAIQHGLSTRTTAHQLDTGTIVIRADEMPRVGDVNRGDTLDSYRQAGNLLAPVRIPDPVMDELNLMFMSGEKKLAWLKRFFPVE
jgi:hypothetical protein